MLPLAYVLIWVICTMQVKDQFIQMDKKPVCICVLSIYLRSSSLDYPHKYGREGGCADHSVFERMKKYQASAVETPAEVSPQR